MCPPSPFLRMRLMKRAVPWVAGSDRGAAWHCCVIIVWQPEACRWIPWRKQVLDVGYIHRGTQTRNLEDTHAHKPTDMYKRAAHTTLTDTHQSPKRQALSAPTHLSNFLIFPPSTHSLTHRQTQVLSTHMPSPISFSVKIKWELELMMGSKTCKYLLILILQCAVVLVCQLEDKHVLCFCMMRGVQCPQYYQIVIEVSPLDLQFVLDYMVCQKYSVEEDIPHRNSVSCDCRAHHARCTAAVIVVFIN